MTVAAQAGGPPGGTVDEGLKRDVGFLGLMWASEGSIIGSGWLFGALTATVLAGPAVVFSWIIASAIVILLALIHAELGGIFHVSGGTSRFPHYAFGSLAGASFGWFSYLQAATVAPVEVLATVQYFSTVSWASGWFKIDPATGAGTLQGPGIVVALALLVVFAAINLMGIKWLSRSNTWITSLKVFVPILAIVVLVTTHFHMSNFTALGGFFLKGANPPKVILSAIPAGGIVFSLLGFEQAVQLGGESSNPKRDIPRAVIGATLIGALIYILVQFAFIGALAPATLAHSSTWATLGTNNPSLAESPYATLATIAGLGWLAVVLRIDAVISPGGTGLIYNTTTSRLSFGLSKNGFVPQIFEGTSKRSKVPVFGIIIATIVGALFLLPFPAWSALIGIVTGASVLMYAGAPLSLGALRYSKPDLHRPYLLPLAAVLCPLAFVCASLIVYWAGWGTYSTLMVAVAIGYILMLVSAAFKLNPNAPKIDWIAGVWIFPYLIGMGIISFFGQFGTGGAIGGLLGKNAAGVSTFMVGGTGNIPGDFGIPFWWDLGVVAVFSLIIYYTAMHFRLSEAKVDGYASHLYPPEGEMVDSPATALY
ncbi:MAG: APC family permease [Candidatus Dormibacteria bacterium]|jgi:amino acid transporter